MVKYTVTCKGIVAYSQHDWKWEEMLTREPNEDEFLVEMIATGVCHTDISGYGGIYPRVLGHEGESKPFRYIIHFQGESKIYRSWANPTTGVETTGTELQSRRPRHSFRRRLLELPLLYDRPPSILRRSCRPDIGFQRAELRSRLRPKESHWRRLLRAVVVRVSRSREGFLRCQRDEVDTRRG